MKKQGPRILTFDIETSYLEARIWRPGEQYVAHDKLVPGKKQFSVLCFAAKWRDDDKMIFHSVAGQKNLRDDKKVVAALRDLLDAADVVISQNGKSFDVPFVRGRLGAHKIAPFSKFKHYDTRQMGKQMGLPSTSLAYMSELFCPELVKSKHSAFPNDSMWTEFMAGNKKAQAEMKAYNCQDVRATEGVFNAIAPYFDIEFSVYHDGLERVCSCGSTEWYHNGHHYSATGKFKKWKCKKCGASVSETGAANNLLSKDKRESLRGKV